MSVKWKTVWIIGASTGIGRELSLKFASENIKTIISARSEDKLHQLSSEASSLFPYPLDVLDPSAVMSVADRIRKDHGPLDLVIYNAGVWHPLSAKEFDSAKFKISMDVNYMGAVYATEAVVKDMMARQQGHIAYVGSVAGYRGLPRSTAYSPTKSALNSFAECMKMDLDRHNVRVTIINPGFVETPMTSVNDFPMPFIMSAEKAAQIIFSGLKKGKYEIAFPWQMVRFLKFMRCVPNSLFFWITKKMM